MPKAHRSGFKLASTVLLSVLLGFSGVTVLEAKSRRSKSTAAGSADKAKLRPTITAGISPPVRFAVVDAFRIAVQRLEKVEGCSSLFADLEISGIEALSRAIYEPARQDRELALCRVAAAMTNVGGHRVRLCDSFASLSRLDKARSLIHEALHNAGLREYPYDPDGPTTHEINERVSAACSL